MKQRYVIPLLLLVICSSPVWAQSSEEEFVKSAINKLFEGMKNGDSAMVKAVFADNAILQTVSGKQEGAPVLVTGSLQQFLRAVGTPHTDVWDERITFERIMVDGALASVWTPYRFYLNEKFSHCGVNSFQLMKSASGWKIIYLVDTRRKEGCL